MIQRSIKRLSMRALMVDDELGTPTAEGRAARTLVQELQGRAVEVVEANSAEDGTSVFTSDSAIHAVLIDWTLGAGQRNASQQKNDNRVPSSCEHQQKHTIPQRAAVVEEYVSGGSELGDPGTKGQGVSHTPE